MVSVLAFLFGLIVGSFLNTLIYRLKEGQGFLWGRSFCPYCFHPLGFFDLLPILSFFLLKGKCRYCKNKISLQYPLVELFTGTLFFLITKKFLFFLSFQNLLYLFWLFIIVSLLIAIFVFDLKFYIIPDKLIYPAIFLATLYPLILNTRYFLLKTLPFSLGIAFLFLAIFLFSKGKWLGFGDVKLVFFMGLFLSFPKTILALFLAFSFGAIIGIGLIIFKKKSLKSEVPFAPFLITGTILALFWGENLINWYLSLLK